MKKLHASQLRANLRASICNFLSNRKIRVKVENTYMDEHHLAEGVPQGSVLSRTCFAKGPDGCLSNLPHGVTAALNVDSGSSISIIENFLQLIIKRLEKWCGKNRI